MFYFFFSFFLTSLESDVLASRRRARRTRRVKVVAPKDPLVPEPKDKALTTDPFAVPNPSPKKGKKGSKANTNTSGNVNGHPSLLAYDGVHDPLPYADVYRRDVKAKVSSEDFAPGVTHVSGTDTAAPAYDPVSDPLPSAENRPGQRSGILNAQRKLGPREVDPALFEHIAKGKTLATAPAGHISRQDNTWANGEFKDN